MVDFSLGYDVSGEHYGLGVGLSKIAKEAITKLPISDGQKCLDVCLWFYPTSWAKQKRGK